MPCFPLMNSSQVLKFIKYSLSLIASLPVSFNEQGIDWQVKCQGIVYLIHTLPLHSRMSLFLTFSGYLYFNHHSSLNSFSMLSVYCSVNVFGLGRLDLLCCHRFDYFCCCRASMDLLMLIHTQRHSCEHVKCAAA